MDLPKRVELASDPKLESKLPSDPKSEAPGISSKLLLDIRRLVQSGVRPLTSFPQSQWDRSGPLSARDRPIVTWQGHVHRRAYLLVAYMYGAPYM
jgi:hypothetical protein